jgi:hypothetical protein
MLTRSARRRLLIQRSKIRARWAWGIAVLATGNPGESKETAHVFVGASVAERDAGPVLVTEVTGGPLGHAVPLASYSNAPGDCSWGVGARAVICGEVSRAARRTERGRERQPNGHQLRR